MPEWVIFLLMIILLPAVVYDCRYHRIPNIISLSGWIIGPMIYAISDSLPGITSSLYGFLLIFSLTFPLYMLQWMGAGDVKLMAGIGAIVGIGNAPGILLGILATGGLMGIVMLLHGRLFKESFQRYGAMLGVSLAIKKPVYLVPNEQEKKLVMPYALPIAIGTFLSIALT